MGGKKDSLEFFCEEKKVEKSGSSACIWMKVQQGLSSTFKKPYFLMPVVNNFI